MQFVFFDTGFVHVLADQFPFHHGTDIFAQIPIISILDGYSGAGQAPSGKERWAGTCLCG